MQEKIDLQRLEDICSDLAVIKSPCGICCHIEDYINCPKGELGQNETYEDFEETWGYKSMNFVNVGGNKND